MVQHYEEHEGPVKEFILEPQYSEEEDEDDSDSDDEFEEELDVQISWDPIISLTESESGETLMQADILGTPAAHNIFDGHIPPAIEDFEEVVWENVHDSFRNVHFYEPEPVARSSASVSTTQRALNVSQRNNSLRNIGRKRQQRIANTKYLTQLMDSDEDEATTSRGTRFTILFEDARAYKLWDEFTRLSEESQNEVLKNCCSSRTLNGTSSHSPFHMTYNNFEDTTNADEAFCHLSRYQAEMFLREDVPLGMVEHLEQLIVDHFMQTPYEILVTPPLNGLQRLMAHGIAAYYSLDSYSTDVPSGRVTRIANNNTHFARPALTLSVYVEHMRRRVGAQAKKKRH